MTLLLGAKAIARHLSNGAHVITARQVRYLIERGGLPTFRIGSTICSTPGLIERHFDELHHAQTKGGSDEPRLL